MAAESFNDILVETVARVNRVGWFLLTSGPVVFLIAIVTTLAFTHFVFRHTLPRMVPADFAWDGHDGVITPEQLEAEAAWLDQMEADHPNGQLGFTADGRMFWSHLPYDDLETATDGTITWAPRLD